MIELKILLDEVDYRSLSEVLIPALAESMAKDGGVLGGMLSREQGAGGLHGPDGAG